MISIRNLSYRYGEGGRDVLAGINLDIQDGSFVALMGRNGSGKSTFARCLNGLLIPSLGDVLVDGLSTRDSRSLSAIRQKVGLVFQDPNNQLTSPTVERELAFGLQNRGIATELIRSRVDDALLRLSLKQKRMLPPSNLSGGEKQRLAIAAVVISGPKYLVLDEPTSFLSPKWRRLILDEIVQLNQNKGITVVLITQYSQEMSQANRLIVLNDGVIEFDGKPSEFTRDEVRQ